MDDFTTAMRLMRRRDAQLREEGFHLLLPVAADHVDRLMAAFREEHDDHGLRCWLLELIGHARSDRALPLLVEEMHGTDEMLVYWATVGLERLDTKEARQALYQARSNRDPGFRHHSRAEGQGP